MSYFIVYERGLFCQKLVAALYMGLLYVDALLLQLLTASVVTASPLSSGIQTEIIVVELLIHKRSAITSFYNFVLCTLYSLTSQLTVIGTISVKSPLARLLY